MTDNELLGPWLRRFFTEHIVSERNLAINTRQSYRYCFKLFLPFLCNKVKKSDELLAINDITSEAVLQFLTHLEEVRGCSVQTRNQRLTAIRAFARFVGSREPVYVEWCAHIRAIQSKKATPTRVGWLTKEQMDAMLRVPERRTLRGRTEYALLRLLYNTGARVSEVTQLRIGDVQVDRRDGRHALVTLRGKGGKARHCPVLPDTERELVEQIKGRPESDAVFLSRYRRPYTRFGVYRLVERCAAGVPALAGKKVTPHTLRHSIACHLVIAKVDINIVRSWLGHVTVDTTNIYAEVDLALKAEALAICELAEGAPGRPWKEQKGLMAFLDSL